MLMLFARMRHLAGMRHNAAGAEVAARKFHIGQCYTKSLNYIQFSYFDKLISAIPVPEIQ